MRRGSFNVCVRVCVRWKAWLGRECIGTQFASVESRWLIKIVCVSAIIERSLPITAAASRIHDRINRTLSRSVFIHCLPHQIFFLLSSTCSIRILTQCRHNIYDSEWFLPTKMTLGDVTSPAFMHHSNLWSFFFLAAGFVGKRSMQSNF